MSDVDPVAVAGEVRRALAAAGVDLSDPVQRSAVLEAVASGLTRDRRLTAAEKAAAGVELRAAGASYDEIAKLVGWASKGAAHKAVMKALRQIPADGVEELRALELRRLDTMLAGGLFNRARRGDVAAIDRVLRIMAERRRYVAGLEVPTTAELTGAGGGPITIEFVVPPYEPPVPVPEDQLADHVIDTTGAELPSPSAGGD